MTKKDTQELIIGTTVIALIILLINPMNILMPDRLTMIAIAGLTIFTLLFASLIWREENTDERDEYHRLLASRAGYLAGATALLICTIYQSFIHQIDPLIPIALGVMVIAKLAANTYNRTRR